MSKAKIRFQERDVNHNELLLLCKINNEYRWEGSYHDINEARIKITKLRRKYCTKCELSEIRIVRTLELYERTMEMPGGA